ncbi:MAG: hypothetical protein ACFFBI_05835 [Promethearchaeota archaeon]
MKRQFRLTLLLLLIIGVIVIPLGILLFRGDTIRPKWHYYIEPGIYTASEEVEINGIKYTLDTFIHRDFFPPAPPNGEPLIAVIYVHAVDTDEFPLSTRIKRLWLIDEGNIISTLATEYCSVDGSTYIMVFHDGPKWEPEIYIDVIVKLKSRYSSPQYLLANNQKIYHTS